MIPSPKECTVYAWIIVTSFCLRRDVKARGAQVSRLVFFGIPMRRPLMPTVKCNRVSRRLNASSPPKSGNVNPNAETNKKKQPLMRLNGLQKAGFFQPYLRIAIPRKTWKTLCHVSGRCPNRSQSPMRLTLINKKKIPMTRV